MDCIGSPTRNRVRPCAGGRRLAVWFEGDSNQSTSHPALATMQNPDDYLLADVAALGHADGAVLDAGFERYRLVVHVGGERRTPRLDPEEVEGGGVEPGRTSLRQRVAKRRPDPGVRIEDETNLAGLIAARRHHRNALETADPVPVFRISAQLVRTDRGGAVADTGPDNLADDTSRLRTVNAKRRPPGRPVLHGHVLCEDELAKNGRPASR